MSRQDKAIAWILILQGVAGSATLSYSLLASTPSMSSVMLLGPMALLSIAAGFGVLRSRRWGYVLGIIVLALQVPAIQTPWFSYYLWLGLQLKVFVGAVGSWQIGINLLALAMLGWISYRYNVIGNSFVTLRAAGKSERDLPTSVHETTDTVEALGFCVIYRARIHHGKEAQYIAAWSRLTSLIRSERGGLGSRLHRGHDDIWYAYAQWASVEARAAAFKLPSVDPAAQAEVADAISEYFPEILMDPITDQLVPTTRLSNRNSF